MISSYMPAAMATSDPKLLKYQEKQAWKAQKKEFKDEEYEAKHPYMSEEELREHRERKDEKRRIRHDRHPYYKDDDFEPQYHHHRHHYRSRYDEEKDYERHHRHHEYYPHHYADEEDRYHVYEPHDSYYFDHDKVRRSRSPAAERHWRDHERTYELDTTGHHY